MLAMLLCGMASAQSQTWTVDDHGPADFPDIKSAIAAAAPGDRLLVQPGTYAAFNLNKKLIILGPAAGPAPKIVGRCQVNKFAHGLVVAGLEFQSLTLTDLPGRVVIDDCRFVNPISETKPTLHIEGCKQVVVSRCVIETANNCCPKYTDGAALHAHHSTVAVVGCNFTGKSGCYDPNDEFGPGGSGVHATGGFVVVADTQLKGGEPGYSCTASCGPCCYAWPGFGALADGGAVVIVRGSAQAVQGGGPSALFASGTGSKVVHSGVALIGGTGSEYGGAVIGAPLEPHITTSIGGQFGAGIHLAVFGPAGAPGSVFFGVTPQLIQDALLAEPIWINPHSIQLASVFTTLGNDAPVLSSWAIPPLVGLEGLTLYFQGVFPTVSSVLSPAAVFVTNPASLVLRF